MKLQRSIEGNVLVIELQVDTLDASNVTEFKETVQPSFSEHSQVVLDLSVVKFVDSSGLGALISCLRILNSRNGDFKLSNMSNSVRALFELMRMHRVFHIYESRQEAVKSFG